MKRNDYREFTRPDGTLVICSTDAQGNRLPTRYVRNGREVAPPAPPKKEPRRIEPKRKNRAKATAPSPTNRTDCVHIGDFTGDSVEQKNCGCPGNKMTSVWQCELFGRVAPFAKGDPVDGVRACQKCGAYRKALPIQPSQDPI